MNKKNKKEQKFIKQSNQDKQYSQNKNKENVESIQKSILQFESLIQRKKLQLRKIQEDSGILNHEYTNSSTIEKDQSKQFQYSFKQKESHRYFKELEKSIDQNINYQKLQEILDNKKIYQLLSMEEKILIRIIKKVLNKLNSQTTQIEMMKNKRLFEFNKTKNKKKQITNIPQILKTIYYDFRQAYQQRNLTRLELLLSYVNTKDYSKLKFIDPNQQLQNNNNIFQEAIDKNDYKNILKFCFEKQKNNYKPSKFFDYCIEDDVEGAYCCVRKPNSQVLEEIKEIEGFRANGFLHAFKRDKIKVVKMLITHFQLGISPQDTGNKPMFVQACKDKAFQIVKFIYKRQPDVISQNNDHQMTGFIYACANGCLEIIEYLIKQDKQVLQQTDQNNSTGFHYACHNEQIEAVKLLLHYDKNLINSKNTNRQTGFIWACRNNSKEVATYLVKKYPSVCKQQDLNECTGFLYACKRNSLDMVLMLLRQNRELFYQKSRSKKIGWDYLTKTNQKRIKQDLLELGIKKEEFLQLISKSHKSINKIRLTILQNFAQSQFVKASLQANICPSKQCYIV